MIILSGSQRRQHAALFEQLYRLRHDVFIKGRGWSLPSSGGKEIDQYDTDEAIYFIDVGDNGLIEASVRATPSARASLLADYFPHLIENGEPARSPTIYECTRYIVRPAVKSRNANREAKAKLLSGMLEWALSQRLSFIQTVIDAATLSSFVEMTPKTIPLGLAHPYGGGRKVPGGGECLAIRWPVWPDVIADIREYGGWQQSSFPQAFSPSEHRAIA